MIRKVVLAVGRPPGPGRPGATVFGDEIPALPELIIVRLEQEGMRAMAQVATGVVIPADLIASKLRELGVRSPSSFS